ncbi:MAG: hypothetical protein EBU85_01940 [Actinobacteria bacterium]|nr:hypothetical protein [Actinomycetota bacterium]
MKRRLPLLAAVLLVVGLAGCGSNKQAGAAAIVGDQRVTEQQLSKMISDAQATQRRLKKPITPAAQSSASALNWKVREILVDAAAKKVNVDATKTEVESVLNKAYEQYGKDQVLAELASNGFSEAEIPGYARLTVLQEKISTRVLGGQTDQAAQAKVAEFWQTLSRSLKIQIAPRYGVWNNDTLSLDPPKSKVATPAGSPSIGQ